MTRTQAKRKKTAVSAEVKLDAKQPIPFELSGNAFYFFEGSERYIPFLDSRDNFFITLLESRLLSVTANACISTRADYCTGNGLTIAELQSGQTLKDYDEKLNDWFKCCNLKGESFKDVLHQINDNLDHFGNCFIEVVRGKAGSEQYVYVYVWNTPECRLAAMGKNEDFPTAALRSTRFLRDGLIKELGAVIRRPLLMKQKPLDAKRWIKEGLTHRTVIHLKNKMSGYPNYGMPVGISSLTQQLLEYSGARYNLDNFENNCAPGGFIGMKGNYTKAEADAEGRNINKQIVGKGKTGRWIVIGHEQGLDGLDVKPFDNKRDGSFIELDNKVESKIILAYQWNKVLAGLDDGSALAKGNAYLKGIYDIAMKKVVIPRQTYLMENFIEPLMTILDDHLNVSWSDEKFQFANLSPVSFISLVKNIDSAVRRNEVRAELGLPEDDTDFGDEYLGQQPAALEEKPDAESKKEDEDEGSK